MNDESELEPEPEPEPAVDVEPEPEPELVDVDVPLVEVELEFLAAATKVPPTGLNAPPGNVEVVAFPANLVKAARVLPVLGALMEPTMPF